MKRHALMGHMRSAIERVTHTGNRVVDKDCLQWLASLTNAPEQFESLLSPRAPFAIPIKGGSDLIDDTIAIAQCLCRLRDGLRGIRGGLNRLAFKIDFRGHKDKRISRRRNRTFWSLKHLSTFGDDVAVGRRLRLLSKSNNAHYYQTGKSNPSQYSECSFHLPFPFSRHKSGLTNLLFRLIVLLNKSYCVSHTIDAKQYICFDSFVVAIHVH